jgi:hypothetical protein
MHPHRNFLPLTGLIVCVASFLSYFFLFSRYPVTRDLPWTSWLLFALGLGLAAIGVRRPFRQPERYRGRWMSPILALLSLGVAGSFVFATTVASRQLPASAGAPKVGEKAPDFVLPDSAGRPVRLSDLVGGKAGGGGAGAATWVVLIFYRGYW